MTRLEAPAPVSAIDQIRAAYWQARDASSATEDALLLAGWKAYRQLPHPRPPTLWEYLGLMVEGRTEKAGSLYNAVYRQTARDEGYAGNLSELATWGKALNRDGWTPQRIAATEASGFRAYLRAWSETPEGQPHPVDTTPDEELPYALIGSGLTPLEIRRVRVEALEAAMRVHKREEKSSLTEEQEKARALLGRAAPLAPQGQQERDVLFLQAAQILAAESPQRFAGAIQAVQTGTLEQDTALHGKDAQRYAAEQFKPPTYVDWGGWHAHSFVSGELRREGAARYQGHHVPYFDHEARRSDGPQVIVFVDDAEHIPQPSGTVHTAHNKIFSPRRDPDKLRALLEYNAVQQARYVAHIRGEPDPWPELPVGAYMVLPQGVA